MSLIYLDSQPANPTTMSAGWATLQATLEQTFHYDPELQARARAMVAWLEEHSLDHQRPVAGSS